MRERPYQFGWFFVVKLVWSLYHTYYYQISRRQTTSCADANCNSFCRTSLGWRVVGLDAFRWVVKCEWMSIIGRWQDNCCWGDQCLHKQVHIGILFWISYPTRKSWVHYPKENKKLYLYVPDQLRVKCECKFQFIFNCCVGAKELVYILYYIVYSRHYYAGCNYFWGFCVSRTHRSQCPLWETPLSKSVRKKRAPQSWCA